MDSLEKLKNLIVMAFADRSMTEREIRFLSDRRIHWGISESEFSQAIGEALDPKTVMTIPKTKSQREELLRDLLRMMAADGKLAEIEKELFASAAIKMEFTNDEIDAMIEQMIGR